MGNLTSGYVKSPLLPHIIPGGGAGGPEYIDRCIIISLSMVILSLLQIGLLNGGLVEMVTNHLSSPVNHYVAIIAPV